MSVYLGPLSDYTPTTIGVSKKKKKKHSVNDRLHAMNINDYTLLELYQLRKYVTGDLGGEPFSNYVQHNKPRQALLAEINKRIEYIYEN